MWLKDNKYSLSSVIVVLLTSVGRWEVKLHDKLRCLSIFDSGVISSAPTNTSHLLSRWLEFLFYGWEHIHFLSAFPSFWALSSTQKHPIDVGVKLGQVLFLSVDAAISNWSFAANDTKRALLIGNQIKIRKRRTFCIIKPYWNILTQFFLLAVVSN